MNGFILAEAAVYSSKQIAFQTFRELVRLEWFDISQV